MASVFGLRGYKLKRTFRVSLGSDRVREGVRIGRHLSSFGFHDGKSPLTTLAPRLDSDPADGSSYRAGTRLSRARGGKKKPATSGRRGSRQRRRAPRAVRQYGDMQSILRLTGELRRLALALKRYRQPASTKHFTVVRQQNVSAGVGRSLIWRRHIKIRLLMSGRTANSTIRGSVMTTPSPSTPNPERVNGCDKCSHTAGWRVASREESLIKG